MSTILKSLFGRQLGLDKDGYLTSPTGAKFPALYVGTSGSEVLVSDPTVTSATSLTTATPISNSGITTVTCTNKGFTLSAPTAAGMSKIIVQTSVACTGNSITLASGAYDASGHTVATFTSSSAVLYLRSISTALFQAVNLSSLNTGVVLS